MHVLVLTIESIKIRCMRAEFHMERQTDRQIDRHDEADGQCLQLGERSSKYYVLPTEGISMSSVDLRTKSDSSPLLQVTDCFFIIER